MRKAYLFLSLLLLLTCSAWGADSYEEERGVIEEMTKTMESYIATLERSDAIEAMVKAINDLAQRLEALIPKMSEMAEKHPDWGDKPPLELQETMERYAEVAQKFFAESLQKTVQFANKFQDDKSLQEAFGKLNLVMSQMGGRSSQSLLNGGCARQWSRYLDQELVPNGCEDVHDYGAVFQCDDTMCDVFCDIEAVALLHG